MQDKAFEQGVSMFMVSRFYFMKLVFKYFKARHIICNVYQTNLSKVFVISIHILSLSIYTVYLNQTTW